MVCRGGGDAGGAGEGGDVVEADHLRERDGGDVERVRDGSGRGDHAGVLVLFEVAGGVGLAAGAEVRGGSSLSWVSAVKTPPSPREVPLSEVL